MVTTKKSQNLFRNNRIDLKSNFKNSEIKTEHKIKHFVQSIKINNFILISHFQKYRKMIMEKRILQPFRIINFILIIISISNVEVLVKIEQ